MKRLIFFILIFIVFVLVFLYSFFSKQKSGYWLCKNNQWQKIGNPSYPKPKVSCPKRINLPKTKESCLKAGGIWRRWGMAPVERCNLKTTDARSFCFDNDECEGWCNVQLTEDELRIGKPTTPKKIGQCSEWFFRFGCYGMMKKGKVMIICAD